MWMEKSPWYYPPPYELPGVILMFRVSGSGFACRCSTHKLGVFSNQRRIIK
jgi:hypothetical protein